MLHYSFTAGTGCESVIRSGQKDFGSKFQIISEGYTLKV